MPNWASTLIMTILSDAVMPFNDSFSIASGLWARCWNTLNRYSQWFCSITPPKVGIYGAIGKYLSFYLRIAKIGIRVQSLPTTSEQSFRYRQLCPNCGSQQKGGQEE